MENYHLILHHNLLSLRKNFRKYQYKHLVKYLKNEDIHDTLLNFWCYNLI